MIIDFLTLPSRRVSPFKDYYLRMRYERSFYIKKQRKMNNPSFLFNRYTLYWREGGRGSTQFLNKKHNGKDLLKLQD
jgi:hypothetical protein